MHLDILSNVFFFQKILLYLGTDSIIDKNALFTISLFKFVYK